MCKRAHALCEVIATKYKGKGANVWAGVDDAGELFRRLRALPGFGEEKSQIFVALLGKRFGVRPNGWQKVAGAFGDKQPRSVADINSPAALLKVRGFKKAQKVANVDKQDRPRKK